MEQAIVFDYKTVKVKRETETMLCDAYRTLGWEVTGTTMAEGSLSQVNVSFKRDRKLAHKIELNRLQLQIDESIRNIERLLAAKKSAGMPEAITLGVIGALTLGGGMSMVMVLEGAGFFIGGIALGVVGIGIGLLGWLVHNRVKTKKVNQADPLIEEESQKFSELCEKAYELTKQQ